MTFEDATSFQDRRTCLPVLRRRTWSPWPRRRGSCSRWAGTPHTASPPPSTWVRFLNTSPFRNAKSIEINQSFIPGNARPYCRDVHICVAGCEGVRDEVDNRDFPTFYKVKTYICRLSKGQKRTIEKSFKRASLNYNKNSVFGNVICCDVCCLFVSPLTRLPCKLNWIWEMNTLNK